MVPNAAGAGINNAASHCAILAPSPRERAGTRGRTEDALSVHLRRIVNNRGGGASIHAGHEGP